MSLGIPQDKIPGLMLPEDHPLRMRRVVDGLYVVDEDPYTDRYSYFESSRLHTHQITDEVDAIRMRRSNTNS
jgi:hypothetical protein